MPAYFVAEIEVTNPDGYAAYAAKASASVAQYGEPEHDEAGRGADDARFTLRSQPDELYRTYAEKTARAVTEPA